MIPVKRLVLLFIFLSALLARLGLAQSGPSLAPVPDAVRTALLAGDGEAARGALVELRRTRPEHADLWGYLEGRAWEIEGNAARAAGAYNALASGHPDSPWRDKADFRRAELLRELGAIEEAEAVWAAAVQRLSGTERQDELAELFLSAADALLDADVAPDAEARELDRAFAWYGKALELRLSDAARDRALRGRLRCALEHESSAGVVAATEAWLAAFAEQDAPHDLPPRGAEGIEMTVRHAQAWVETGKLYEARRELEDLLRKVDRAVADGVRIEGLAPWRSEAIYWLARAWQDDAERAVATYRRYVESEPAPRTVQALDAIALAWAGEGRTEEAVAAYDEVLAAESRATDAAGREADVRRRVHALYAKGSLLAQAGRFEDAIATLREYTSRYPGGAEWTEAQRAIESALIDRAASWISDDREAEGRAAIAEFLAERPLHPRARELALESAESWVRQGYRSMEDGAEDEGRAALTSGIAALEHVAQKFPGTDAASRALYVVGEVNEYALDDPRAALEAYRKCTFGNWSHAATERRREMVETSLEVLSERAWTTDESPRLAIEARNLEELEVRIYALDLETYFRKHATHEAVEDLDLDLIEPDRRVTIEVPEYRRYVHHEFEAPLPVEGAGVWAVTVVGGDLTATTLVIVSDIDVVAKISFEEMFVFAQDVRADAPAAGVRVLCAVPHGDRTTLQEAFTDETGVARFTLDAEGEHEDANVLALRDGHAASCGWIVGTQSPAFTTVRRAFVHTDRNVYRRGDVVHWRAVARELVGGVDRFTPGEEFELRVVDPSGRTLRSEVVALNDFGSLSGDVALSEHAAFGSYRIDCAVDGTKLASTSFKIQDFRLQHVALEMNTERDVYYRGETVTLEFLAKFHYGSPVASTPIALRLPDGREVNVTTDEHGLATYEYDSSQHARDGALRFRARLLDEDARADLAVHLATHAIALRVEADRDEAVLGDELLATVHANDPAGAALAVPLQVEWLRLIDQHGGTAERRVSSGTVTSDADGDARIAFRPEEGGAYRLRVSAVDRFRNPISAHADFDVSGDDDPQRLRFFAKRREYGVGETAQLDLVDRTDGGLTLITIETDRVADYRVTRSEPGRNLVRIDLEQAYAPNVRVTLTRMTRGELIEDAIELDVRRELIVEMVAPDGPIAPGEEVEVSFRATDLSGEPVVAELSLAVVDEALFELFPHDAPSIRDAFRLPRRDYYSEPVNTISSCDFEYFADTRTIAAALIAEAARREEEARWRDRREKALGTLDELASKAPIESPASDFDLDAFALEEVEEEEQVIGFGGGAGGSFGGRMGGKRNLRAAGGAASSSSQFHVQGLERITAYWNPSIATGDDGRATVRFRVPEKSTAWRLTSHGAGLDGSFGDAGGSIVVRGDWFVELLAPYALTEGDRPALVARVHNPGGKTGELTLQLSSERADVRLEEAVRLSGEPIVDVPFTQLDAVPAGVLDLRLDARGSLDGEDATATDAEVLTVRAWGLDVHRSRSGALNSRRGVTLALPDHAHLAGRELTVRVGAGIETALLEALDGDGPWRGIPVGVDTVTDDALHLIGLIEMAEQVRESIDAYPGLYADLRARAQATLSGLMDARLPKDGWPRCREVRRVDPGATAYAAIAVGRAHQAGLDVDRKYAIELQQHLLTRYREIAPSDSELRASYAHALARLGAETEDLTNRLYRERETLSAPALSHLALAFLADRRAPMAREIADVLARQVDDEGGMSSTAQRVEHHGMVRQRALALLALQAAAPDSPAARRLADNLAADRPWGGRGTRGLVVAALASRVTLAARTAPTTVVVRCADHDPVEVTLDASRRSALVTFELGEDDPAKVQLDLDPRGGNDAEYVAVLSGTSPVVEHQRDALAGVWRLRYVAAAPTYRGRDLPVGFSSLTDSSSDAERNPRREVETGGRVTLQVLVQVADSKRAPSSGERQVLEVPIPPGTRIDERSLESLGAAYEIRPDRLVVDLEDGRRGHRIEMTLLGLFPGDYRALPATIRSLDRPHLMSTGGVMELRVLPRGVGSEEPYNPSPDELLELGRRAFRWGDRDLARIQLEMLYRRWGKDLRPDPARETSQMLFELAVERGDQAATVEHFELLGERAPNLEIGFKELRAVADAYRESGEHENALRIERAMVVETFGRDLRVAGALTELGDFRAAVGAMRRLWLEYPDVPSVIETSLTVSDQLLAMAPNAADDARLRAAGVDRATLTLQGILELQRFLAIYADDPQASDAALNLLAALFDLEDYERAEEFAGLMAGLAERPRYLDAFLYSQAIARWELGRDEGAMELLERIAAAEYPDDRGRLQPSENRDLALYLLAQIHHARREFAEAAAYYERVSDQFSDAAQALDDFHARRIAFDEVHRGTPGEAASIELRHRNLAEVELLVYPVDLMTLYLRERSLSEVAAVELSGIAPLLRRVVPLERGVDLRDRETTVELGIDTAGAYLVMARAEDQFASGLLLVSDLALEVESDPESGRVRVQVVEDETGAFVRDVDVRVIGEGNAEFSAGRSDARGVFVADGVVGEGTVIAYAGDRRYAFRRGVEGMFGGPPPSQRGGYRGPGDAVPTGEQLGQPDFFSNVRFFNDANRELRSGNFIDSQDKARAGLQLQEVQR